MASLRTRLLAGVLLLSAAGLVLLGVVTYAEQRSFLLDRVDQQARAAVLAFSHALDSAGFKPPADRDGLTGPGAPAGARAGAHPGRPSGLAEPRGGAGGEATGAAAGGVFLPPGTWGQRRLADGRVLGEFPVRFSSSEGLPPAPRIPASIPIGRAFTVGSAGDDGVQYRAYAGHDPDDTGLTVVAIPLRDVTQTLQRLLVVEALVIGGVLLALGVSALFVVRLGLRPLDRIEVTAGQIAAGDLSHRIAATTPRTEVGRLGIALNRMLDRLERAFADREASEDRLRQFLADASHELRTPLASIRGYAELFRMGAASSSSEVETAMRRIEEESARMGVLVEDLLTLARQDEAPEPRRVDVDLAQLARDVVADAHATAPGRPIALRAPARAVVSGDPHKLHQVLANLMRNALVHTPADAAIEVSVRLPDRGQVEVSVRDHGPGLPPGDPERLFARFWRSEAGRGRGRAGAGLGLAIAHDVVTAHGGRIEARDAAGGGAEFCVRLPVLPAGAPSACSPPRGDCRQAEPPPAPGAGLPTPPTGAPAAHALAGGPRDAQPPQLS